MADSRFSLPLSNDLPDSDQIPLYDGDMEEDLKIVSRSGLAGRITGGLSFTSKMPCPSWGISATRCRVGSLLARREGTTCSHCYALRGHYLFSNVHDAQERRYAGLFHPLWTPSMVFLINYFCDKYFRWFDAGDIQGISHLTNIVRVAQETPQVRHWLPTREAAVVRAIGKFPDNLVVRVSAAMIDGEPPRGFPHTSTVVSDPNEATCPAPQQEGVCGECRRCWEEAGNVAYRLH